MQLRVIIAFLVVIVAYIYSALLFSGPFDPLVCCLTYRTFGCPAIIIDGQVAEGFESSKSAFRVQFETGHSKGAQWVLWENGKEVVNLYGSYGEDGYDSDSLQTVFSSTKAFAPLVIGKLMEQGLLDIYDPVAKHWPEFAAHGKENITITEILRHEAGLDALSEPIPWSTFIDLDNKEKPFHKLVEDSDPVWYHNISRRSYHGITIGLLLNEIVKRVDPLKRNLAQVFHEEFTKPLGVEFFIGLPDEKFSKFFPISEWPLYYTYVNAIIPFMTGTLRDPVVLHAMTIFSNDRSKIVRGIKALRGPDGEISFSVPNSNRRDSVKTVSPATNGVSNAKSMAKILAMVANYGQLDGKVYLKRETIEKMLTVSTPPMEDALMQMQTLFTDGGWAKDIILKSYVGWGGLGGSLVQFSPQKNQVFVYVMTGATMGGLGDRRTISMINGLPTTFTE
eukprot:TRINITY_DN651_c0_g2_i1.p1 TRINITY_DN651_c0_g2~~TRINITY_DN651_c0_g2_i1.p1  ORF type:complete len:449 (+),score=68.83 TRINITY_DN651_c0_g2_i1:241-1587(+)